MGVAVQYKPCVNPECFIYMDTNLASLRLFLFNYVTMLKCKHGNLVAMLVAMSGDVDGAK